MVVSQNKFIFIFILLSIIIRYCYIKKIKMQGNMHKHKRTVAQDILAKSLSQSIDLSLNRYSFNTDHGGPLTLRLTHFQSSNQEENQKKNSPAKTQTKMKKSNIQQRSSSKIIQNLRTNLLHLQQKLSYAHKQINSHSNIDKRSTIGAQPNEFQKMLGLFVCNQVSQDESTINLQSQKLLNIKSRQKISFTLQMNNYYTGHLVKALLGTFNNSPQHLSETIVSMKKAMLSKIPSQVEIQSKKIVLKSLPQENRKTLILELQQTLLYTKGEKQSEDDVDIGTGINKFYVSLRPYLFSFLKKIKQFFEIVVFTTLPLKKANQILEEIDPERKFISDCLGQQHCQTLKSDIKCKDIRIINRNMKQICIVDSKADSILFQPQNWIPILPFRGGQDRQLMQLQRFLLKQIYKQKDIREIIRNKFKTGRYWQYQNWENLVKQLYLE